MKPEIKAKWVAALRSGEYEQGKGALRTANDKFCCLGVLCDIHARETGVAWSDTDSIYPWAYLTEDLALPKEVMAWAGLSNYNPKLGEATCASHNDGAVTCVKKSFSEIADLIEANL